MRKLICFMAVALAGCSTQSPNIPKAYFNFDSLINTQVALLMAGHAVVEKSAVIDGKEDHSVFKPDSAMWAHEMEMFRYLDVINRPVNVGAYAVTDQERDPNSNLLVKSLEATRPAQVRKMKFYYDSDPAKLRRIEAVVEEQTTLYATSRLFRMEFDNHGTDMLLSRYSITGVQKIILSDSVSFAIAAEIHYDFPN